MTETVSVAFIGCGKRAHAHLPGLAADSRCRLVAACDVVADSAAVLLTAAGTEARVYTDHREMLAREQPDLVITPLWTGLHFPVFRDCVQAEVKAVLCEKPMAPSWGECLEMAELARTSGTMLTFCHQRRFAAGNQLARRLLAEGVFGEVERMDIYSPKGLLDCGVHSLDQALMFNQETPAKWVLAGMDTSACYASFGLHAESHVNATIVFANDVRAHFWCGGPDQDLHTGLRLMGSKGFFEIDWGGHVGRAIIYDQPQWRPPAITQAADAKTEQMGGVISNAVDCLISGEEAELSYHKSLRSNEIVYAMFESVRRRERIELPLQILDHPLLSMIEAGEIMLPNAV